MRRRIRGDRRPRKYRRRAGRTAPHPGPPREPAPGRRDERLGFLLIVRCALASAVVAFALFDGHSLGAGLTKIGVPCVLFLAAAGAVEWYRRRGSSAATHVDQAMLVADSLFLVAVTCPRGSAESPGRPVPDPDRVGDHPGRQPHGPAHRAVELLAVPDHLCVLSDQRDRRALRVHAARPTSGRAVA